MDKYGSFLVFTIDGDDKWSILGTSDEADQEAVNSEPLDLKFPDHLFLGKHYYVYENRGVYYMPLKQIGRKEPDQLSQE